MILAQGGALNHLKNDENHTQSINSNITTNPASNAISKLKICFILEASIPEKIYPASSFIALATSLSAFAPCEFYLAFKDNRSAASQIQNALKDLSIDVFTLCNLDFNTLKFALSKMHCVIGGDTGLTYLAWLLNTPVISLYGNKIGGKKGSKNMKDTSLERILLGNAYLVSKTNNFEIASIAPADISTLFQNEIYPKIKD